jgi:hypothetical protein
MHHASSGAIPMPVSLTAKRTLSAPSRRAETTDFATGGEFQRVGNEIAQDLRELLVVGVQARQSDRLFENQINRRCIDDRPEHAAQR